MKHFPFVKCFGIIFISYSAFLKLSAAKGLVEGSKLHDLHIHHTHRIHIFLPMTGQVESGAEKALKMRDSIQLNTPY